MKEPGTKTTYVDPMLLITLKLATIIDPLACGQIEPEGFDMKTVDPDQLLAIRAAQAIVGTICMVVEQEYATYFARAHQKASGIVPGEPN